MTNASTKKCPYCAETVLIEARKCKHCGEFFEREQAGAGNNKLVTLAESQRWVLYAAVGQLIGAVLLILLPPMGLIVILFANLFQVGFIFRLATLAFETGLGICFAICSLIPFLGLIFLAGINMEATRILRQCGCKVGLMGLSRADIARLRLNSR